ncbi:MAG: hypothetical protein WD177_06375, partial [Methylophaga sp.]
EAEAEAEAEFDIEVETSAIQPETASETEEDKLSRLMADQALLDDEDLMKSSEPAAELAPEIETVEETALELEPEAELEPEVVQKPEPDPTAVESAPSAPEVSVNQQDELARLRERLREKTAALKASNTNPVTPTVEPSLINPAETADDVNQTQDNVEADNNDIDDASSFDSADWPQPEISEEAENQQSADTDTAAENQPEITEDIIQDDAEVVTQQTDNEPTQDSEDGLVEPAAETPIFDEQKPSEVEEHEPEVSADEPVTTQDAEPSVTDFDDALDEAADLAMAAMENETPATSDSEENSENTGELPEVSTDQASAEDAPTSAEDFAAALAAEQAQAEQERLETESQMANFEEVSQPPLPQPDELDDLMSEVNDLQRRVPDNADNSARLEAAAALPLPDNASLNKLMQEVRQLQQTAEFKPVAEKGQQDLQQILSHIPRFGGKREGGNN